MDHITVKLLPTIKGDKGRRMEQLSGVMIIIIIGGGVLTFVALFIFAKRQIMRFTLRSRRGPHVPVGQDAPKSLRREIERRLDCVQRIAYEPRLLWDDDIYVVQPDESRPPYYYRMRAVDDIKILESEIAKTDGSVRYPHDSLRAFLLVTLSGAVNGPGQRMIHQFCDMYEHARHDPNDFGLEEYESYRQLLLKLIDAAKTLKTTANSRKTSPSRTPVKKHTKMHSFLDPSKLRPPPVSRSHGSTARLRGIAATSSTSSSSYRQTHQQSKVKLTLGLEKQQAQEHDGNKSTSSLPSSPSAHFIKTDDYTLEDDIDDDEIICIL